MCVRLEFVQKLKMNEIRTIGSLPLAPHLIRLLTEAGFKYLSEIIELGPIDLARGHFLIDADSPLSSSFLRGSNLD
jgi:hypothetical protein